MLPAENAIVKCLAEFIVKTQFIIHKLDELKGDIEIHHNNCNTARTVGTSVGTVGSVTAIVCFIASPFTLGATLPFAIAGTIASAAGGITNVSTSITDMYKSKNYKINIEKIGNERNECAKELTQHLENLNQVALELQKNGLNQEDSYKVAFIYAKFGYNAFMLKKDAFNIAVGIMNSIKLAEGAQMSGSIASALGFTLADSGKVINLEFGPTFFLVNTLAKFGIEIGKTAKEVIGGLITGVSLIFIVTDIVFLVRDWQSEHPTCEMINEIIKTLNKELEPVKELFEFFTAEETDTVGVNYEKEDVLRMSEIELSENSKNEEDINNNNDTDQIKGEWH